MYTSINTIFVVKNNDTLDTAHTPLAGTIPIIKKEEDQLAWCRIDGTTPDEIMYKCFYHMASCLHKALEGDDYEAWRKRILQAREKIKTILNNSL